MKLRQLAMIVVLSLVVASCANVGGPKQIGGGLLGGIRAAADASFRGSQL